MRWFHIAVVVIFAAVTFIFAIQNFQAVTIDFLGSSASLPFAVWIVIVYLLGMATGGSVWSLLRRAIEGSRKHDELPPQRTA